MHITSFSDVDRFADSYRYLDKHCHNQQTFHEVLDQLAHIALPAEEAADSQNTSIPFTNKVVAAWKKCFTEAKDTPEQGLPVLGLRLIQLMQFGSKKGWFCPKHMDTLMDITDSCLLTENSTPRKGYKALVQLISHLFYETQRALPSNPVRFEYFLGKYCTRHYEVLAQADPKTTKIQEMLLKRHEPHPSCTTESAPVYSEVENAAATELQKHIRRWNTHHRTIFPDQVAEIFKEQIIHFPTDSIDLIVHDICKQMTAITSNPDAYKGKPIQFIAPLNDAELQNSDRSSFTCQLELNDDGTSIELLISNNNMGILSSGTYKDVIRTQLFHIPLHIAEDGTRATQYIRMVLLMIKNDSTSSNSPSCSTPSKDNSSSETPELNCFFSNADIQQRLNAHAPDTKLIPRRYLDVADPDTAFNELKLLPEVCVEPWLNSTLFDAFKNKCIPLDFTENHKAIDVTLLDLWPCIIKAAEQLEAMHRVGIVHLDVKFNNILLCLNGDIPEAFLTDSDLAKGFGDTVSLHSVVYRDRLAKNGRVTPCSDWWGFAMSLGEVIIPTFASYMLQAPFRIFGHGFRVFFIEGVYQAFLDMAPSAYKVKLSTFLPSLDKLKSETMLTKLHQGIEALLESEKDMDPQLKKEYCALAFGVFAAKLTFQLIQKAIEMDQKAYKIFNKETASTILSSGSFQDRFEFVNQELESIPLAKEFVATLKAMQTQLEAYKDKLGKLVPELLETSATSTPATGTSTA